MVPRALLCRKRMYIEPLVEQLQKNFGDWVNVDLVKYTKYNYSPTNRYQSKTKYPSKRE